MKTVIAYQLSEILTDKYSSRIVAPGKYRLVIDLETPETIFHETYSADKLGKPGWFTSNLASMRLSSVITLKTIGAIATRDGDVEMVDLGDLSPMLASTLPDNLK